MKKDVLSKLIVVGLLGILIGGIGVSQINILDDETERTVLDIYPLDLSMVGLNTYNLRNVDSDKAPSVDLEVKEDQMLKGNYVLNIKTKKFNFTPKKVSRDHKIGEGHAHIYVDGVQIGRSYSGWFHIPRLKEGEHTIKATLNTNEHEIYAVNRQEISDSVSIDFDTQN